MGVGMHDGPDVIQDGYALAGALFGEPLGPAEYLARMGYAVPPLEHVAEDAHPVAAQINHGLWIAPCPCGRPLSGSLVWCDEPLMWCAFCTYGEQTAWRRVILPKNRAAIERVLSLRPDPVTRNWLPGESLALLKRENHEHGVSDGLV